MCVSSHFVYLMQRGLRNNFCQIRGTISKLLVTDLHNVRRLYRKFLAKGSVADAPLVGRPITVTTPNNMETMALSYIEEVNQSVRPLSTTIDISEYHFEHLD